MFRDLDLKPTYNSYDDNVGEAFFDPVLKSATSYDRATAYFSGKALSNYSKGLEYFARSKDNRCRLIVSNQISVEDYNSIKAGYDLKETITNDMLTHLREELSLEEERSISNLAYLVSLGVIDVKIAFSAEGLFHDKFGILRDANGDTICFRGSNNETDASFRSNYESFDLTCSWLASKFDFSKITKSRNDFEELWNNQKEKVVVKSMDQTLLTEIETHNKGELVYDVVQLKNDCLVLDYDGRLFLDIKLDDYDFPSTRLYKLKLKRYIDSLPVDMKRVYFDENLRYPTYKKIINVIENDSHKRGYTFYVAKRLKDYIRLRELHIDNRSRVGLAIKKRDPSVQTQFENYKAIVDASFVRPLRENQMWDSFFMCMMRKSCNFSVPGSGKTASVLGVFAYLRNIGQVNKIVMIGPKNSFGSWKDEFRNCFGDKLELRVFDLHSTEYSSTKQKSEALLQHSKKSNLILLNYESVANYKYEILETIDNQTLLVFDEVHKIKNPEGFYASNCLEVAQKANHTIVMTGTPIPNTYLDIENMLHVLFDDEYEEFFGFDLSYLKNPDQEYIDEINRKIRPFFCRTSKDQLSVPQANPDSVKIVDASKAENKVFEILCNVYARNRLALIIRLLQLESNPAMLLEKIDLSEFNDILDISGATEDIDYVDYSSDIEELVTSIKSTAKFDLCIETAKQLFDESKPTIIWCIFVDSLFHIKRALESFGASVAVIFGKTSEEDRTSILNDFRNGKLDFLITNPHTLAESVSLHKACHDAIYFEYSYNLVHLLQSKDRIHRLGLPEGQYTQYFFLQEEFMNSYGQPYSLDRKIYDRLKEKEQIMLDAIEAGTLENGYPSDEDLDIVFKDLRL